MAPPIVFDNDRDFSTQQDSTYPQSSIGTVITCRYPFVDSHSILILIAFALILILFGIFFAMLKMKKSLRKAMARIEEENLSGKTVLITGANEGIGAKIAELLAYRGCRLVMLVRDVIKARTVADRIQRKNPTAEIAIYHIDLSSMTSVRVCVNEILNLEYRIDILINCASVAFVPGNEPTKSIDGFELHLATNFYGHFLLTHSLINRLKHTGRKFGCCTKVINVTSMIYRSMFKSSQIVSFAFKKYLLLS